MHSEFEIKAREIRRRFIARTVDQQTHLTSLIARLGEPGRDAAIGELAHLGHWISGSAGTFGLHELGELAQAVEQEIASLKSSSDAEADKLTATCNRLLAAIRELRSQENG
jgi:HPt (histidine-containing phosphotransfer) domain-containing protein